MTSVRLDDEFIAVVKERAEKEHRSIPKQIEHWAKIGRIMEENPDLTYSFVESTLSAAAGQFSRYTRRT